MVFEVIENYEGGDFFGKDVVCVFIVVFKEEGWDFEDYGVGGFDEDLIVCEVMVEYGNVEKCGGEYFVNLWQCEGSKGYYLVMKYEDYQGNIWLDEENEV